MDSLYLEWTYRLYISFIPVFPPDRDLSGRNRRAQFMIKLKDEIRNPVMLSFHKTTFYQKTPCPKVLLCLELCLKTSSDYKKLSSSTTQKYAPRLAKTGTTSCSRGPLVEIGRTTINSLRAHSGLLTQYSTTRLDRLRDASQVWNYNLHYQCTCVGIFLSLWPTNARDLVAISHSLLT